MLAQSRHSQNPTSIGLCSGSADILTKTRANFSPSRAEDFSSPRPSLHSCTLRPEAPKLGEPPCIPPYRPHSAPGISGKLSAFHGAASSSLVRFYPLRTVLPFPWQLSDTIPGLDLHGNTYWEFRVAGDPSTEGRWRRIVHYPRKTHHGDVDVSPAWHQWLRNTRTDPPSLEEQAADIARQERMKVLAAQADARWASKANLTGPKAETPGRVMGQPVPALGRAMARGTASEQLSGRSPKGKDEENPEREKGAAVEREETWRKMQEEAKQKSSGSGPWKKATPSGPGETWQPQTWQPPATPGPKM